MSFLASDVITTRVTPLLARQGVDMSPTNALVWLSDGLIELRAMNPRSFIDTNNEMVEYAEVTALDQSIPLDVRWRAVLTDYVMWRCFQEDAQSGKHAADAENSLKAFLARAKTL